MVEWTATAREMIGRKEYRFLSPSFLHNKAGQIMRLKGAGLVHNPNLYLTALASQEDPMKPNAPETADRPAWQSLPPPGRADRPAAETSPNDLLAALKAKFEGETDPARYMPGAAVQSMLAGRMESAWRCPKSGPKKASRAARRLPLVTAMKPWARPCAGRMELPLTITLPNPGRSCISQKPSHATGTPPALASEASASDLERAVQNLVEPARMRRTSLIPS
ncbi:MAG: hypothetical protein IPL38_09395 [Rhodobacter sp.]|nr:hypothetical protein [Rhodobacter sp.]